MKRKVKILVVDDEPMIARAMSLMLQAQHEVQTALSGAEALSLIGDGAEFDVILSDLMMPNMSGMEFFEHLQRTAPAQAEHVIFVTGGVYNPQVREFVSRTCQPVLEKPFKSAELRALVNSRLG